VAVAGRHLFHLRLRTLSDQFDPQSSCPFITIDKGILRLAAIRSALNICAR
jgi:hypothetical protein